MTEQPRLSSHEPEIILRALANDADFILSAPDSWMIQHLEEKDSRGRTALMVAAYYGCKDAMEALVQRGADSYAVDDRGISAVQYAKEFGVGISRDSALRRLHVGVLSGVSSVAEKAGDPPGEGDDVTPCRVSDWRRRVI